jgi:hypothetical protein
LFESEINNLHQSFCAKHEMLLFTYVRVSMFEI